MRTDSLRAFFARFGLVFLGVAVVGGGAVAYEYGRTKASLFPAMSTSLVITHESPNVLLAVRDLARLESAEYHMEKVMDLKEHQSSLFGLVQADDAILLVAVGDVTAGVDFSEIGEGDVTSDFEHKTVTIALPPARVLSSRLDNDKTYVHTRQTDWLAARKESLESQARAQAEKALTKAAEDGDLLKRADGNARRTVEQLMKALGYREIHVTTRGNS